MLPLITCDYEIISKIRVYFKYSFGNVEILVTTSDVKNLTTASPQVSKQKSYYLQNFPGTSLAGEKD